MFFSFPQGSDAQRDWRHPRVRFRQPHQPRWPVSSTCFPFLFVALRGRSSLPWFISFWIVILYFIVIVVGRNWYFPHCKILHVLYTMRILPIFTKFSYSVRKNFFTIFLSNFFVIFVIVFLIYINRLFVSKDNFSIRRATTKSQMQKKPHVNGQWESYETEMKCGHLNSWANCEKLPKNTFSHLYFMRLKVETMKNKFSFLKIICYDALLVSLWKRGGGGEFSVEFKWFINF